MDSTTSKNYDHYIPSVSLNYSSNELLLLVAFSVFSYAFYKWATLNDDYFEKRNIKHLKPKFLIGNTGEQYVKKATFYSFTEKLYNEFSNEP